MKGDRPKASLTTAGKKEEFERQVNQLVAEVRLLENYYQEIVTRQQAVSSALIDTRAALEALENIPKTGKSDLLLPIGGGVLLPVNGVAVDKVIVSIGAGAAVEKDIPSTKTFLQSRKTELEKGLTNLEQQRKEVGSRLDVGRASLEKIANAQQ
jgi:prefoldin alpha subunit